MPDTATTTPPPAAPVPLTAVPEAEAAPVERTKRKYTKRAAKWAKEDKPKRKYTKRAVKAKPAKAAKAKKAPKEKKAKRVAGTKFQGQGPKSAMRFAKAYAKENDTTIGVMTGTAVVKYLKSLGWDPEA